MAWTPKPGERVLVPSWGAGKTEAVVLAVYRDPPMFPYVVVEMPVRGSAGEVLDTTTMSFELDRVQPVDGETAPSRRRAAG